MLTELTALVQSSQQAAGSTVGTGFIALFLTLAVLLSIRRIRSSIYGAKFSKRRLFFRAAAYLILTTAGLFSAGPYALEIYMTLALIPPGMLAGLKWGSAADFFYVGSQVYYRRSFLIVVLWLVTFIGKVLGEVLFPDRFAAVFVIAVLLSSLTGVILGETVAVQRSFAEFRYSATQQG